VPAQQLQHESGGATGATESHSWADEHSARVAAAEEQRRVDAEVGESRRRLLQALRQRDGSGTVPFLDEGFLETADRATLVRAIVEAAVLSAGAARADLQLYDADAETLQMAAHHGFRRAFLDYFRTVERTQPTSGGAAVTGREPVLVDDIRRSPIFAGQPSLEPLLDAGSLSIDSYPLLTAGGDVLGVLSFHHDSPTRRRRHDAARRIVAAGAHALEHMP
jgi:hypothetical protein